MNLNDKLTLHFRRSELVRSAMAARRGLPNLPTDPEHWANLKAVCLACAEPARVKLGPIAVLSGFRSPEVNALVGGAASSQHMKGEALDLVPIDVPLVRLFDFLRRHTPFDQLIWEFGEWVHVSHRRFGEQRGNAMRASHRDGRTVYEPWVAA